MTCGTDFSRCSDAALRLAVAWARRHGEEIRLVHALEGAATGLGATARQDVEREMDRRLATADVADAGLAARRELIEDEAIRALAPPPGGITVVGAEGSAATLLRRAGHVPAILASCLVPGSSLLVAPPGWLAGPPRRRRAEGPRHEARPLGERVLVACSIDDPTRDRELVRRASAIARSSASAEIHLAHGIDLSVARHHPPRARADLRAATEDGRLRAADALRALADDAPIDPATSRPMRCHVVAQGPVARDLAGLAISQSIDLLVAGRGSVAASLAGFTACPLLIVG